MPGNALDCLMTPSRLVSPDTGLMPPLAVPPPSSGAVQKRFHSHTPYTTRSVVTQRDMTPSFHKEILIPIESLLQSILDRYFARVGTPRVPTKRFLEESMVLPRCDTMMEEAASKTHSTPSDDVNNDPDYAL